MIVSVCVVVAFGSEYGGKSGGKVCKVIAAASKAVVLESVLKGICHRSMKNTSI